MGIGDFLTEGAYQVAGGIGRSLIRQREERPTAEEARVTARNERIQDEEIAFNRANTQLSTIGSFLDTDPKILKMIANNSTTKDMLVAAGFSPDILSHVTKLGKDNIESLASYLKEEGEKDPVAFLERIKSSLAGKTIPEQLKVIDSVLKRGRITKGRKRLRELETEHSNSERVEQLVPVPGTPELRQSSGSQQAVPTQPKEVTGSSESIKKKLDKMGKSIDRDFKFAKKIESDPDIQPEQRKRKVAAIYERIDRKQARLESMVDQLDDQLDADEVSNKPISREEILASTAYNQQMNLMKELLFKAGSSKDGKIHHNASGERWDRDRIISEFQGRFSGIVARDIQNFAERETLTREEATARMINEYRSRNR